VEYVLNTAIMIRDESGRAVAAVLNMADWDTVSSRLRGMRDRVDYLTLLCQEARTTIEGLADQQAMPDYWYEDLLNTLRTQVP